ncbi:MAG: OmpA family protein [Endomicrobia bacterium]|nr:OmpA family protein [Endomicrobiia bacterium]
MKKHLIALLSLFLLCSPIYSETIQPQEPSLTVKVENKLFSPVVKSGEGVVFFPKIEGIKKIRFWSLTLANEQNKTVREIKGKGDLPEKIVWDGLSNKGEQVDDGQYSYKFDVQAFRVRLHEEGSQIFINSTPPFVSLKCGDVYFIDPDTNKLSKDINIYLSCGDELGIDYENSYVRAVNYNDVEVKKFKFKDSIPEFISWDGRDDIYGNTLPAGNYKISFIAANKAGNVAKVDSEISVMPMPKEPPLPPAPEQPAAEQPAAEQPAVEQPKEEPAQSQVSVKEEERGLVINLSSKVLFDVSKSAIKPEAEQSLDEVAGILKVYPANNVLIEGHTDSSGKEKMNLLLSMDRAKAVYDFLVSKGVDGARMQVFGYGDKKPVAPNTTERGKELNRRVEIIILKADASVSGQAAAPAASTQTASNPSAIQQSTSSQAGNK